MQKPKLKVLIMKEDPREKGFQVLLALFIALYIAYFLIKTCTSWL